MITVITVITDSPPSMSLYMQEVFKSKVCETKSLAPASNRMSDVKSPRTQTTQSLNLIARNWSYHYKNTHKTARLLMHMCIPSTRMIHGCSSRLPMGIQGSSMYLIHI